MKSLVAFAALVALTGCATLQTLARGGGTEELIQAGVRDAAQAGEAVVAATSVKCEPLNPSQEYFFGRAVAAQIVQGVYQGRVFGHDSRLARYVSQIGAQVSLPFASGTSDPADRPEPYRGFTFIVVDSPKVDAFGVPGGFVVVTTGLVAAAKSEDALAGALAHEVSHVRRGHGAYMVETQLCATLRANAAFAKVKEGSPAVLSDFPADKLEEFLQTLVGKVVDWIISGYSRDSEDEADRLGAQIARSAGYDPMRLASLLQTLSGAESESKTHAAYAERAMKVKKLVGDKKLALPTSAVAGVKVRDARYRAEAALPPRTVMRGRPIAPARALPAKPPGERLVPG